MINKRKKSKYLCTPPPSPSKRVVVQSLVEPKKDWTTLCPISKFVWPNLIHKFIYHTSTKIKRTPLPNKYCIKKLHLHPTMNPRLLVSEYGDWSNIHESSGHYSSVKYSSLHCSKVNHCSFNHKIRYQFTLYSVAVFTVQWQFVLLLMQFKTSSEALQETVYILLPPHCKILCSYFLYMLDPYP